MAPSLHDPLFCGQLIADTPDGEQVTGLAGIILDLLANLAHEDRNGVLVHLGRLAPQVLIDAASREHLSGLSAKSASISNSLAVSGTVSPCKCTS